MATRTADKQARRKARLDAEAAAMRARRARMLRTRALFAVGAGLLVLGGIFVLGNTGGRGAPRGAQAEQAGAYKFAVGNPGPGAKAPSMTLPSTAGGSFSLAAQRGKTTLLYFQEGLGCQPCWDQMKDIEARWDKFRALGIDQMVSITGNDLNDLRRKAADDGIKTPVLADAGLTVSRAYEANKYGMMGDSANGHSFLVVGPKGDILYRADYGGAPDYTMYVPVPDLVADIRHGLATAPRS